MSTFASVIYEPRLFFSLFGHSCFLQFIAYFALGRAALVWDRLVNFRRVQ